MFEFLRLAIAIVGGAICGLYDLKTTNMLDWLAIAMIISGLFLNAMETVITGSAAPIIFSLSVAAAFFLFGFAMYKAGYWGGGDGELLIAIGALVPVNPFAVVPLSIQGFSFSVNFFINSFIVGGIYSILYAGILAARDRKIRKEFYKRVNEKKGLVLTVFLIVSAFSLSFYSFPYYMHFSLFLLALMPILYLFAKSVEEIGFYRRIHVSELKVDDMIGEDLPDLGIFKKEIRGLTEDEVKRIKKHRRYVTLREGVRYSPVFVISLIVTLVFGGVF